MTASSVAVLDWSAISPLGVGRAALAKAVAAASQDPVSSPARRGNGTRRLDAQLRLSNSGRMDRLSAIAVETAKLIDMKRRFASVDPSRMAVVLGTTTGSLPRMAQVTHDSLTRRQGHMINPSHIPSLMLNAAAGHIAIEMSVAGPNSTVAAGYLSGLSALATAVRHLRSGQAEYALVGAVEEISPQRLLASRLTRDRGDRSAPPVGEGCALLLLQGAFATAPTAGEGALRTPEVLGVRFGFSGAPGPGQRDLLLELVDELATDCAVDMSEVCASMCQCGPAEARAAEREAVKRVLGADNSRAIVAADLIGDTYSAANAFQIIAALAANEAMVPESRPVSLITATGSDGEVAAALIRHP